MSPSIEETIDRVEQLYATITGRPPPEVGATRAPAPTTEGELVRHVEEQLAKLIAALERGPVAAAPRPTWMPRAALWRDDSGFELALDVPGVTRDQLELRVNGRVLVVRGDRPSPWGTVERSSPPIACEAPFGRFVRTFALPEHVEPSHITARLDAGTLRVRVERSVRAEPSQIPILCS